MAILDQHGRKVAWKAARGAQDDGYRPWEPVERKEIHQLIPALDRQTLASHARRIYINFGPVKNAISQRGMYAVGRAWKPEFRGTDKAFGDLAKQWLVDVFYKIGDVRGGMHDFQSNLFLWSKSIDVDGEQFILLTETKNGFPQYQSIPSHRIRTPKSLKDGERVRGGIMQDGVVLHQSGAAKEYAFCDADGNLKEWLPSSYCFPIFEPEWANQGRGITQLAHCINDMRDLIQSNEWERLAMMQMSAVSMIEYNEHGGPDPDDPFSALTKDEEGNALTVQSLEGGTVRYFRSNSGGKIEMLQNTRPGSEILNYHDRLLKAAYAGLSWPFAFYEGSKAGGGTAQRTEIAIAQRAIEDRQDLLMYAVNRVIGYGIAKAIKRGDLPPSRDWYKWGFSMPPKLTIDDGRVMKELESGWRMGTRNHREIVGMIGKNLEDHYMERAEEVALRKLAAQAAMEKFGVPVEEREMAMLTPNEMSTTNQNNGNSTNPEQGSEDKAD